MKSPIHHRIRRKNLFIVNPQEKSPKCHSSFTLKTHFQLGFRWKSPTNSPTNPHEITHEITPAPAGDSPLRGRLRHRGKELPGLQPGQDGREALGTWDFNSNLRWVHGSMDGFCWEKSTPETHGFFDHEIYGGVPVKMFPWSNSMNGEFLWVPYGFSRFHAANIRCSP